MVPTKQKITKKKLTRIRLINWHAFSNETININGSCLITGENATGKSTILDAIQLILTTNTRKFNSAANEKSKRDLKGYVRYKIGEEGNTYIREKSVISYVALEFYEESKNRYFVLGAKFDSPDENAEIKKLWYCEEGNLDQLDFIVNDKPALDEQFKNNGKKVVFIRSSKEAKDRFKRRLGNLDETFFDIIQKSLAFKPIDNVKKFITQFILPEKQIDVELLRGNIRSLKDMQVVIQGIREQITDLEKILSAGERIDKTDEEILVIRILLKIAELEEKKALVQRAEQKMEYKTQELIAAEMSLDTVEQALRSEEEKLRKIQVDISNNSCSKLIDELKHRLEVLEAEKKPEESKMKDLRDQVGKISSAFYVISDTPAEITMETIKRLLESEVEQKQRLELVVSLKSHYRKEEERINIEITEAWHREKQLTDQIIQLQTKIDKLKNNQIDYPENTEKLKYVIRKEFAARSIESEVRIFADLLEIQDSTWQNAVEGYLNTQRFNIIVDPKYYDIAAETYHRNKGKIEGVTLINTQALDLKKEVADDSLAATVISQDIYAKAYANYLMGRVKLCDEVGELKKYAISITKDCMLYQGKGLRKIPKDIYKIPYIGKHALQLQLKLAEEELYNLKEELQTLKGKIQKEEQKRAKLTYCNFDIILKSIDAPQRVKELDIKIRDTIRELKDAEKDPTIIELQRKSEATEQKVEELKRKDRTMIGEVENLKRDIKEAKEFCDNFEKQIKNIEQDIEHMGRDKRAALQEATKKFEERSKSREAGNIRENYERRKAVLENQKGRIIAELMKLQSLYKEGALGEGLEYIPEYGKEYNKLAVYELSEYETKLTKAKADCELQFRENFLAQMRENIESAKDIFKDLNRALRNIYYGEDSYKFHVSPNRLKQELYNMITSEVNLGGFTLFSNQFEEKYHEEMEMLFSKLTESDEHGEKILREYTDYREYMDYDIEILSKRGSSQLFSKIYGEKSGGETQTPYYVAIAASFAQIYSGGETIRIIMLDEAFDKMDDDRIESMMQFFQSQDFQIILATPPAKADTIGEYVDTVLMTFKSNKTSYVEEFSYVEM